MFEFCIWLLGSLCGTGFSLAAVSRVALVAVPGLPLRWPLVVQGLQLLQACGIFPDQGSNLCLCIGRQTLLNHWTSRKSSWCFRGTFPLLCCAQSCLTVCDLSVAHWVSLFMEFSVAEYWSRLPFLLPGGLPGIQGWKPHILHW